MTKPDELPDLVGTAEVADWLGTTRSGIRQRVTNGQLPPYDFRLSRRGLWQRSTLLDWIETRREAA